MGTQRVKIKGVRLWLIRWACRVSTRDFCSALDDLSALYKIFFPPVHYLNFFVSIAQHARQADVVGRLSLSMYVSLANNSTGKLTMLDFNRNRTIFTSIHRDYMYVLLYAKMHGL